VGLEFDIEPQIENARRDAAGLIAIDLDLCSEKHLKEGMEITLDELEELLYTSEYMRAKSKIMWYISRRDYCSGELYKKLKKEFPEEPLKAAIERVTELGLINDELYAEKLARVIIEEKGISPKTAPYLMAEKGLSLELAKRKVSEREDDPKDSIRALIERKYLKDLSNEKGKQKVFAALYRKGYSYGDIRAVFSEFDKDFSQFGD